LAAAGIIKQMPDAHDMDLIREFARANSEAAFTELVRRHLNLVYSVARRCTGTDGDAQDVTQAVFIILARKAGSLREKTLLTGWLYETTRFAAARLLRTNARRQVREQEAYMQSILNEADSAAVWEKLSPYLETGISSYDCWLVKVDSYGRKQWEAAFGGDSNDSIVSVQQTQDGSYIVGSDSSSGVSGNKTSTKYGNDDYWALKFIPPLFLSVFSLDSNHYFQMQATGIAGTNYVFQASKNLTNWTSLQTNTSTHGLVNFLDTNSFTIPARFYRVQQQP
jgi:RNA polymerase sigma factor (sigma-70 family)